MGTPFLSLRDIEKRYGPEPVLRGVSLDISAGEILALLGPSGCGKTTLLRIISGLEEADSGAVLVDGEDISGIPVHKRRFGMVFQDYALFPHKNVAENVAFGLQMISLSRKKLVTRVTEVLDLVGLHGYESRAVFELSGGEQQRVALARSLAPSPRLLLLDEPLGSLDRALRERLMGELRAILKQLTRSGAQSNDRQPAKPYVEHQNTFTSIYVTHDQEEAFAIADRVAVMNEGQIEGVGSSADLYRDPRTPFVARFLGMENLLHVTLLSGRPPLVSSSLGELRINAADGRSGEAGILLIRPEAAALCTEGAEEINVISGEMRQLSFRGLHQVATIEVKGADRPTTLKFTFDSAVSLPSPGAGVKLALNPDSLLLLE